MQTAGDILVVDDEQSIVDLITEVLEYEGYSVRASLTVADARAAIVEYHPDLMLLDLLLPGEMGDILVQDLKDDGLGHIPVILMTANLQAARECSMDGIAYC